MRSLGIRVAGEEINLCILDIETKEVIIEKIILPNLFNFPKKLKYLRFNLIDILSEYNIHHVSIKTIEYNSKNVDINRCFIEGVIQETLATSNVVNFKIENIKGLSKKINLSTEKCKVLISDQSSFTDFMAKISFHFKDTNKDKREAALLALSNIMEKNNEK